MKLIFILYSFSRLFIALSLSHSLTPLLSSGSCPLIVPQNCLGQTENKLPSFLTPISAFNNNLYIPSTVLPLFFLPLYSPPSRFPLVLYYLSAVFCLGFVLCTFFPYFIVEERAGSSVSRGLDWKAYKLSPPPTSPLAIAPKAPSTLHNKVDNNNLSISSGA